MNFLLGLGVTAASWPFWWGSAMTPRWALVSVLVPLAVARAPRPFLLALPLWGALSLAWTPVLADGLWALWVMCLAVLCTTLAPAPTQRDFEQGFVLGMCLNVALAFGQMLSPTIASLWPQAAAPAATFGNKNLFGEAALLALCMTTNVWALMVLALGVALAQSKAVWVALCVVGAFQLRGRAATAASLGALALLAYALFGNSSGVENRLEILAGTINGLTPLGHGIGAFYADFPATAPNVDTFASRPTHAHMDTLELAFDLGLAGLFAAALWAFPVAAGWGRGAVSTQNVLIAGAVLGLFSFPLHNPATLVALAYCAGRVMRCGDEPCGEHVPSGSALRPWLDRACGPSFPTFAVYTESGSGSGSYSPASTQGNGGGSTRT